MESILLFLTISLVGLYLVGSHLSKKHSLGHLPPGPPRKPIIGNLTDLPSHDVCDWEYWLKHKDLYGKHLTYRTGYPLHQDDYNTEQAQSAH